MRGHDPERWTGTLGLLSAASQEVACRVKPVQQLAGRNGGELAGESIHFDDIRCDCTCWLRVRGLHAERTFPAQRPMWIGEFLTDFMKENNRGHQRSTDIYQGVDFMTATLEDIIQVEDSAYHKLRELAKELQNLEFTLAGTSYESCDVFADG